MSLSLAARRARLLALRDLIDAHGGGAVELYGGSAVAEPEDTPPSSPLVIVALEAVSFSLHATESEMALIEVENNAALSGVPTWARFVDGAGTGVLICSAGAPGSGAQLIVSDGDVPPTAQMYAGGLVTVNCTITEL